MSLSVEIKKDFGQFVLDVSLETDGGVSGLLGASGSGKSMTLMCVAGIEKPDSGRIVLNGRTLYDSGHGINLTPQQRRVGYLFQNYALFPNMTVRQNILCGLRGEKDSQKKERLLREMVAMMQLEGLEQRRPGQLSGGQQQRAALARILIGDPDMLVLDEPFSALDSHLRDQLQLETQKLLSRFGKDVIVVTHSRDEAYHMCRSIALINSGRIIAHNGTKQLFADPGSREAALLTGCKNIIAAEKAGDRLVNVPEWGVRFTSSQPVRDGLCAIGIRAHYFGTEISQNRFPVQICEEIESPFEYNMQFRFEGQTASSQNIWWLLTKEKKTVHAPQELGVAPESIMLLYECANVYG